MTTPICDLIEKLLSRGTSPAEALDAARIIEAAATSGRVSKADQRQKWRLKKARQRARQGGHVPGDKQLGYSSSLSPKTQQVVKKTRKKESAVPHVPGDNGDDWPEDHVELFWTNFPPYRRQAKAKVAAKLARIRSQKVTWAAVFGGVLKFAATGPGEFAPAPMVWLNDGRWDREYGNGGSNARANGTNGASPRGADAVFAAARRRAGGGGVQRGDPGQDDMAPPAGVEPGRRAGP